MASRMHNIGAARRGGCHRLWDAGHVARFLREPSKRVGDDEHSTASSSQPAVLPSYVRARGGVRMVFSARGGRTALVERGESGGYRVRCPRRHGPQADTCEAVLINTGGGMAGGDRMAVEAHAGPGASAVVTTQAAEKIYRSQGPATALGTALRLEPGSRLDWVPQETILFSGSRWHRTLAVDTVSDATLTLAETTVFGRLAMRETVEEGTVADRWRVRRDGRLVFADDVRLGDDPARQMAARASGGGARALATILHVAPGAELRIDGARGMLDGAAAECGASAWNGMLLMRFASPDPQALRADVARAIEWVRARPMPRSWG